MGSESFFGINGVRVIFQPEVQKPRPNTVFTGLPSEVNFEAEKLAIQDGICPDLPVVPIFQTHCCGSNKRSWRVAYKTFDASGRPSQL
jgi:hypothetical protein